MTASGDGDGDGGEKDKEKEKEKEKDPKKHLDPFERNGGKSIPLQLKALNECLLGRSFALILQFYISHYLPFLVNPLHNLNLSRMICCICHVFLPDLILAAFNVTFFPLSN